jgi:putative ABC transport system permease protein
MAPVSDPRYSYILAGIALLILFVACINFVTISIGRSLKRAKEVGIRKVVGAERNQLIFQFIGEALIVTLISMLIGLTLSVLNLPYLNGFMAGVLLALIAIIGLIAGSYPAFVLSGFKPISILKGNVRSGNAKLGLRKVLVGVQLVLSIFLISSTLVMKSQLDFLQNKNLGFNREQLAVIQMNVPRGVRLGERVALGFEQAEQFKTALAKNPEIIAVCASSHDFGNGAWTNIGYTDDNGTYRTFNLNIVDDEYIPALKMELVQGRNFSDNNPSDKRRSVIVNEAFAKEYGWTDAVGKRIPGKGFNDHEVIGVVKDFNYTSLYTKVQPLLLVEDATIALSGSENINFDNSPLPKLMLRIRPGNISTTMDQVKETWNQLTGGAEFSFTFVDQAIASQYRNDQNLGRIVSVATMLAILIGSLGLYGLASLSMQNRLKEVSIRKVLGATERSLLVLLSKEYVYLVAICLALSVPVTVYLMKGWLSSFEYRVDIGPGVFLIAGGISLAIAFFTISYQTLRTAWTQPAKTLKYE